MNGSDESPGATTAPAPAQERGRKRPAIEGKGTLSHQLRTIIKGQATSPYAIAREADIDPKVLGRFLDGQRGLTLASADRLAVALGLRLGQGFSSPHRGKARTARRQQRKAT